MPRSKQKQREVAARRIYCGDTAALIVVDFIERRGMTAREVAKITNGTEEEVCRFVARLKKMSAYEYVEAQVRAAGTHPEPIKRGWE